MKFTVYSQVFDILPNCCFGVVIAHGIENSTKNQKVGLRLLKAADMLRHRLDNANVKDTPEIKVYRDAFTSLGFNPNKFPCSIEALVKRICKGSPPPSINTAVDLGNAISLQYILPIGAHDLTTSQIDIELRLSKSGDTFLPFGQSEPEQVEPGELVYARGNEIKTRRWIWRQGASGMIQESTSAVFYPIDGFTGLNDNTVRQARDELAETLSKDLGCQVTVGWVDATNPEFTW